MKVREVLRLLQDDGWYLAATREAIVNSSIRPGWAGSRLRASPVTILPPEPSTAFSNKPASSSEGCMRYAIVIEIAEGDYSAYVPDLPGCVATGATVEETGQLIREAIDCT